MHTRYFQVGGVIEDVPRGWAEQLRKFTAVMPTRADQYGDLLNKNEIVLQRLRNTCPLDAETLLSLGVTGPLLRAAGNPWDLRKAAPYCFMRISTSRSRWGRWATTTTASRCAWPKYTSR